MTENTIVDQLGQIVKPRQGLYLCNRTSGKEPPCDDAFRVIFERVAHLCCRDVTENVNNRTVKIEKAWAVEVTDMQEFVSRHGDCVVTLNNDGFHTIEIYDDYRE
jgi:predicted esterase YcpF (UPF0227 family)